MDKLKDEVGLTPHSQIWPEAFYDAMVQTMGGGIEGLDGQTRSEKSASVIGMAKKLVSKITNDDWIGLDWAVFYLSTNTV